MIKKPPEQVTTPDNFCTFKYFLQQKTNTPS